VIENQCFISMTQGQTATAHGLVSCCASPFSFSGEVNSVTVRWMAQLPVEPQSKAQSDGWSVTWCGTSNLSPLKEVLDDLLGTLNPTIMTQWKRDAKARRGCVVYNL